MARHSAKKSSAAQRAVLRAGLTLTAAGAALGGGAMSAGAAEPAAAPLASPVGDLDTAAAGGAVAGALTTAANGGLAPVKHLKLNPLSGTGVDPLDNVVGTQVADFKPVTTAAATGPVARGGALADLPLVGPAGSLLPG
ncbi:hypothetical protein ACFWN5_42250 [Streptomyces sp. NPDC058430]|uniref:hypothetical protein n=1 Tax=unclassified Streptomyces TaxID=2593676 RepID=UPI0036275B3D